MDGITGDPSGDTLLGDATMSVEFAEREESLYSVQETRPASSVHFDQRPQVFVQAMCPGFYISNSLVHPMKRLLRIAKAWCLYHSKTALHV